MIRTTSPLRRAWRGLAAALALGAMCCLAPAMAASGDDDPKIQFERYKLSNGLEVILAPDNTVPLVAVNVWYHVGSGDEVLGKSGFAHLFEHMLFQGSQNVGEDQHFERLKQIGASGVNGTTNSDRTNYFEVVPSHELEMGLWLEADRMGYLLPLVTEKSLDNQIEVVRNERRQGVDNVPYGRARLRMSEELFPEGHPYRYQTIGQHEDLASASLEDVKNFYKTWYVPANATLALVGDFDVTTAKKLVDKWFGAFPASTKPVHQLVPAPAIQKKRVEMDDDLAKLRMVTWAWHTPAFYTADDAALDLAADALGRQGTGRLYRRLVHEKRLAQSVFVSQQSQQMSSVFAIAVVLQSDAELAEVEKIIAEELDRVVREPITQAEIDRAIVSIEASQVWGLEDVVARANALQAYNHYLGDPDRFTWDLDRYRNQTPASIKSAAAKHLGNDHRIEMIVNPTSKGGTP
jgi:zinc protease